MVLASPASRTTPWRMTTSGPSISPTRPRSWLMKQHAHLVALLQLGEQFHNLALHGHVQRGGRFVGNQQLGFAGDGNGDHHALLLAARQAGAGRR